MSKGLLFFCCSCCILVLTIINISIGPITSGKMRYYSEEDDWGTLNYAAAKDNYDTQKDNPSCNDDCLKYGAKWILDMYQRKKGMHDMEYTAFIFDIVIGFVCGLIGLLHLFDLKKDFVSNTGLIGLGCGFVGFVLTFVYVILNGLVYTNYYDTGNRIDKRDSDGAFAELDGNKYKCLYFDKAGNGHSYFAKYSDLGKKQYNYNKGYLEDLAKIDGNCKEDISLCRGQETILNAAKKDSNNNDCKFLYIDSNTETDIVNKDISDRFLTALILSIFVCLANIGLALFGFLLFRAPSDF
jgi:hypothetical protein